MITEALGDILIQKLNNKETQKITGARVAVKMDVNISRHDTRRAPPDFPIVIIKIKFINSREKGRATPALVCVCLLILVSDGCD